MQAQGFKRDRHLSTVIKENFSSQDEGADLLHHLVTLGDKGAARGPRHQGAVRAISPVSKRLPEKRPGRRFRGPLHGRACSGEKAQRPAVGAQGGDDPSGQVVVILGLVVEGAVWLHVHDRRPLALRNLIERLDLIDEKFAKAGLGKPHRPPAETLAVRVPGMSTDLDAAGNSHSQHPAHRLGVARVGAARDAGRADEWQQSLVFATLTDVRIEVDRAHRPIVRRPVSVDGFLRSTSFYWLAMNFGPRRRRQKGQGMVEFALILVLIALVVIGTMMVMGNTIQNNYWNIVASFDSSGQTPEVISCHQAHYNCGH